MPVFDAVQNITSDRLLNVKLDSGRTATKINQKSLPKCCVTKLILKYIQYQIIMGNLVLSILL